MEITYRLLKNVSFHTHGGGHVAKIIHPNFDIFGKIKVNDWVYIGACSQIATGSIVTKSVPEGEGCRGIPAKKISTVSEYIEKNLKYNIDTKGLSSNQKQNLLLALPEGKFIKK